jgi:hypothetical protein
VLWGQQCVLWSELYESIVAQWVMVGSPDAREHATVSGGVMGFEARSDLGAQRRGATEPGEDLGVLGDTDEAGSANLLT